MVLLERDGITVEAQDDREAAEYKKLGFKVVPAAKPERPQKAAQPKIGKPVEPEKVEGGDA